MLKINVPVNGNTDRNIIVINTSSSFVYRVVWGEMDHFFRKSPGILSNCNVIESYMYPLCNVTLPFKMWLKKICYHITFFGHAQNQLTPYLVHFAPQSGAKWTRLYIHMHYRSWQIWLVYMEYMYIEYV